MQKVNYLFLLFFCVFLLGCQAGSTDPQIEPSVLVAMEAVEKGLLPAIVANGDETTGMPLEERMAHYKVVGVSIAILKDGKVHWAKGYGVADSVQGTMVDTNTLFQAGSISKPVAALAALRLVQEGEMELDKPINTYLKSWKIPEHEWSEHTPVTLRHLLTHTGGLTVHGFPGYSYSDTFPDLNQVLKGKGNTDAVFVDTEPGTIWRYSGGGYTIMEQAVEDVSGMPLEEYTRRYVLDPLGMKNSTYTQPLTEAWHLRASAAYDREGHYYKGGWHNYPEQAAAGLWTTPLDLLRYAAGMQSAFAGESETVINQSTAEAMLTKHQNDWGLGPALSGEDDSLVFQHGGKNAGFSNVFLAFAKKSGDGLVVMTNSDGGVALMNEIKRSASHYYGWGIAQPRRVDTISIPENGHSDYAGDYVYSGDMEEMQGYKVKLYWQDGALLVDDPQNGEKNYLWALSSESFIDKNTGDSVAFDLQARDKSISFVLNGRYPFRKNH